MHMIRAGQLATTKEKLPAQQFYALAGKQRRRSTSPRPNTMSATKQPARASSI
jgi:hypothetical protein